MFFPMDSTILILIPPMLLAMYAQMKVTGAFNKYSKIGNRNGLTGAQVATELLRLQGVKDVTVSRVVGNLTDHYDPRDKHLRLSDSVYASQSLAAIGVAAHETGHAIQHNQGYTALTIRNAIFPAVNISSKAAMPLIFIGLLLGSFGGGIGLVLMDLGIILFAVTTLFQVITLPVEFNASNRAIKLLESENILASDEIGPAKKVLSAAALTYVAEVAVSLANLLRFLALSRRNNND